LKWEGMESWVRKGGQDKKVMPNQPQFGEIKRYAMGQGTNNW